MTGKLYYAFFILKTVVTFKKNKSYVLNDVLPCSYNQNMADDDTLTFF